MPGVRSITIIIIALLIACSVIQPVLSARYSSLDEYTGYADDYREYWDDSSFLDYLTSLLSDSYKKSDTKGQGTEKGDDEPTEPSDTPAPAPTSTPAPEPDPLPEVDTPGSVPITTPPAMPATVPSPESTPEPAATGGYTLPTGTVPYPPECLVIDRTAWLASGESKPAGSPAENNTTTGNTTTGNTMIDNTTIDSATMAGPLSATPVTTAGGVDTPAWKPGTGSGSSASPGIPLDIPLTLLVIACTTYIGFVAYSIIKKG